MFSGAARVGTRGPRGARRRRAPRRSASTLETVLPLGSRDPAGPRGGAGRRTSGRAPPASSRSPTPGRSAGPALTGECPLRRAAGVGRGHDAKTAATLERTLTRRSAGGDRAARHRPGRRRPADHVRPGAAAAARGVRQADPRRRPSRRRPPRRRRRPLDVCLSRRARCTGRSCRRAEFEPGEACWTRGAPREDGRWSVGARRRDRGDRTVDEHRPDVGAPRLGARERGRRVRARRRPARAVLGSRRAGRARRGCRDAPIIRTWSHRRWFVPGQGPSRR